MINVYTFTDSDIQDLTYELADDGIANDGYAVTGVAGSEVITRGYWPASILKYGKRSMRLDNPILLDGATATTLITAMLDRYIEPYPVFSLSYITNSEALMEATLILKVSDKITIDCAVMGITGVNAIECIVENIQLAVDEAKYLRVNINAVQVRADEQTI